MGGLVSRGAHSPRVNTALIRRFSTPIFVMPAGKVFLWTHLFQCSLCSVLRIWGFRWTYNPLSRETPLQRPVNSIYIIYFNCAWSPGRGHALSPVGSRTLKELGQRDSKKDSMGANRLPSKTVHEAASVHNREELPPSYCPSWQRSTLLMGNLKCFWASS